MSHFRQAVYAYAEHFNIVALYSLLLLVGALSALVPGANLSSGTAFLPVQDLEKLNSLELSTLFILSASTVFVYSFLTAVLLLAVGSSEKNQPIASMVLHELVGVHTSRIFLFNALVIVASYALHAVLPGVAAPVAFVFTLPLLFVPAAIVVDELGVWRAMQRSFDYLVRYPANAAYYVVAGTAMVAFLAFVGYAFDQAAFIGKYVSLLLSVFLAAPLLTILQLELYLHKHGLLRQRLKK